MLKGNLLIVDDEAVLVKQLLLKLKGCAGNIFTAADGIEALDIMSKETVHCVICDVSMPRMNGVELIKNVRLNKSTVPFIFYSGFGNHELMLEVAKYGAFDFLDKPSFDGLEEVVVRGLIEGSNQNSEVRSDYNFVSEYQKLLNNIK
jgi:YesN/AraC family two-component response regulator